VWAVEDDDLVVRCLDLFDVPSHGLVGKEAGMHGGLAAGGGGEGYWTSRYIVFFGGVMTKPSASLLTGTTSAVG